MSSGDTDRISNDTIENFCRGLIDPFNVARKELSLQHPDWSLQDMAGYLMEFGRAQISEIEQAETADLEFISTYVSSLRFDNPGSSLFGAFAAGCLMGLVKTDQLPIDKYVAALDIAAGIANTELA
jgi:hypothetical protein